MQRFNIRQVSQYIRTYLIGQYLISPWNAGYGSQCVDLFNLFNRDIAQSPWPPVVGAKDLWEIEKYGLAGHYKRVDRYAPIQTGDVPIWDATWGGGYGHVGVVDTPYPDGSFDSVETNAYGNPNDVAQIVRRDRGPGLIGFLRPLAVDDETGEVTAPVAPSSQVVHLPGAATGWYVYPLGVAPVVGNQVGSLNPSLFGGLTYPIQSWAQPDVAVIRTRDYGDVQIYVGPDTGATVS